MRSSALYGRQTWALDPAGSAVHPSAEWEHVTGQPREETLGEGWLDRVKAEDARQVQGVIREAATSWAPWSALFRVRRRDGDHVWFFNRANPAFDPHGGAFLGFYGLTTIGLVPDKGADRFRLGHPVRPVLTEHLALVRTLASRIGDEEVARLASEALKKASRLPPPQGQLLN